MAVPTISCEELRQLLDRGAAVTMLDVRPAAERAEWSIPGSVHVDAYDALRRGDAGALADFHSASGGPVVTVCAEGKTSLLAAERLHIVGSRDDAVVIDPSLDPQVYRDLADRRSWQIRSVIETHVHADHLSRARALAAESGALPGGDPTEREAGANRCAIV